MATDKFELTLIFDEAGELYDVLPGRGTEGYKREEPKKNLQDLCEKSGLRILSGTIMLYGHGSPGWVIYRTSQGYIRVWKPQ